MNRTEIRRNLVIVLNDLVNHEQWQWCTNVSDRGQFEAMAKTLRQAMDALDTFDLVKKPNGILEDLECFDLKPTLPQTLLALRIHKYPENITNEGLVNFLKKIHDDLETRHIDHSGIPLMSLVDREELLNGQLVLVKEQIKLMAKIIARETNNLRSL